MTYEGEIAKNKAKLERLQDDCQLIAETEIRRRLRALQERFPRHSFTFTQGMGAAFVSVSPDVLRLENLGDCESYASDWNQARERFPAFDEFHKAVERIVRIALEIEETFQTQVGDVTP